MLRDTLNRLPVLWLAAMLTAMWWAYWLGHSHGYVKASTLCEQSLERASTRCEQSLIRIGDEAMRVIDRLSAR